MMQLALGVTNKAGLRPGASSYITAAAAATPCISTILVASNL
jgi:hypothetical protein